METVKELIGLEKSKCLGLLNNNEKTYSILREDNIYFFKSYTEDYFKKVKKVYLMFEDNISVSADFFK
jgi:hypothetical protein